MVPTTIRRSAWRGEKRGSAAPNRSVSYGDELTAMNSIAQHAVTNGYGNKENLRAQPTSSSFLVVRYSNAPLFSCACAGTIAIVLAFKLPPWRCAPSPRGGAIHAWDGPARSWSPWLFGHGFDEPRLVDVRQDQHE